MQKDQILLNPEEPPCPLLKTTSEPPERDWRWAVPKAERSTGWQHKGDGCSSSEFTVELADVCVAAEDQSWKQEQKGGKAELVHYFCHSRSSPLGFGRREAMVLPGPCGRRLVPQPRRWNNGWDKIYVIISSFTARKPITTTVLLGQCLLQMCLLYLQMNFHEQYQHISLNISGICLLRR